MRTVTMYLIVLLCLACPGMSQAQDKAKTISLFNGKDLTGWKLRGNNEKANKWQIGHAVMDEKNPKKLAFKAAPGPDAELVNVVTGVDMWTEAQWGDAVIELEFMVPTSSNSGIYVMGEYEVQILDSWGRAKVGPGDLGGLYGASAPKVNASKKPGEWQKFVIDYQAPRFQDGKKVSNMKFNKVVLNDQVIHENVEMKGPTPTGVSGKEAATGPLMFQGNHGPVSFRNIRITPK